MVTRPTYNPTPSLPRSPASTPGAIPRRDAAPPAPTFRPSPVQSFPSTPASTPGAIPRRDATPPAPTPTRSSGRSPTVSRGGSSRSSSRSTPQTAQQNIEQGQELTATQQFELASGVKPTNIDSLNQAIQRSSQDPQVVQQNLRALQQYNTQAEQYQSSLRRSSEPQRQTLNPTPSIVRTPAQTPGSIPRRDAGPQLQTSKQSDAPMSRNEPSTPVSAWAESISKRQQETNAFASEVRNRPSYFELERKDTDGPIKATAKASVNIITGITQGMFSGTTEQQLQLTAEKALFNIYAGGVSVVNPEVRDKWVSMNRDARDITVNTLTPIDTQTYARTGQVKYDPDGTATLGTILLIAGAKTSGQIRAQRTAPPKTTGKITSENIQIKGTVKSQGQIEGTPTPLAPQTTTSTIKFTEGKAGIPNKIMGRGVETSVRTTSTGKIIKTQTDGQFTYKTSVPKGSQTGTLEVFKDGQLISSKKVNQPITDAQLQQFESLVKTKSDPVAINQADNVLYQSAQRTSVSGIRGKVSPTQKAEGAIKARTTSETLTQSGTKTTVTSDTTGGQLTTKSLEVTPTRLQVSQDVALSPRVETSNVGNMVTAEFNPQLNTVFGTKTNFQGNLKVSDIRPSMLSSKSASLGQDPALSSVQNIGVPQITIPNTPFSLTVPQVTPTGTSSAFSILAVPQTPQREFTQPTNQLSALETAQRPTLGKIQTLEPVQRTTPSQESILAQRPRLEVVQQIDPLTTQRPALQLRQRSGTRQGQVQIQQPRIDTIQEPINTQRIRQEPQPMFRQRLPQKNPQEVPLILPRFPIGFSAPRVVGPMGFNVFTRKAGQVVQINRAALTKEEAVRFGQFVVGNTARASFRLEEAGRPATGTFKGRGRPETFDKKDDGWFVEKNKFRISSPGELKEITQKGIFASQQKRKSIFGGK